MNSLQALIVREWRLALTSWRLIIIWVSFWSVTNWLFFRQFFNSGQATMMPFFELMPWVLLVVIPAMTMRVFSEENRDGTLSFLFTLPISNAQIVLSKLICTWMLMMIAILGTVPILGVVLYFGQPDIGQISLSYGALIVLSTTYLVIGVWGSAMSSNQVVAFILSILVCLIGLIVANPLITLSGSPVIVSLVRELSIGVHYFQLIKGTLYSQDIIFYGLVCVFFYGLTVNEIHRRRRTS